MLQADWNIVKNGWDAHVLGKAPHKFKDAVTAVKELRVSFTFVRQERQAELEEPDVCCSIRSFLQNWPFKQFWWRIIVIK